MCGEIIAVNVRKRHSGEHNIITPATCEKDGVDEINCTECNSVQKETIPAVGHDYAYTWNEAEKTFTITCSNVSNGKVETCEHPETKIENVKEYAVNTVEPTCVEGVKEYIVLTDNGEVYSFIESIPRLGHMMKNGVRITNPYKLVLKNSTEVGVYGLSLFADENLTCKEESHASFQCIECGVSVLINIRLAHKPIESTIVIKDGKKTYKCSSCNQTIEEDIA